MNEGVIIHSVVRYLSLNSKKLDWYIAKKKNVKKFTKERVFRDETLLLSLITHLKPLCTEFQTSWLYRSLVAFHRSHAIKLF